MKLHTDLSSKDRLREKARRLLREQAFDSVISEIQEGELGIAELLEAIHLYHAEVLLQQEALRESQTSNDVALARFSRLYRDLPFPALLISWTGLLKEHNRAAGELLAMDCRLFPHLANSPQAPVLEQALRTAQISGRAECREVTLRGVRYEPLIVDLVLILLPGWEQQEPEFICAIVDQTDRIAQRDALRATAEVVDASTTVAVRWRAKPGLPLVYASDNVRRWGYPAETFRAGYVYLVDLIHPDDRGRLEETFAREIAERRSRFTLTFRLLWADGSVHWVELNSSIQARTDGVQCDYQGLITDVTERETAQAALRQELRFRELVADISSRFVKSAREELDRVLAEALERIGRFFGVDRGDLYQWRSQAQGLVLTQTWRAEPGDDPDAAGGAETGDDLACWSGQLAEEGLVCIPDVAALPPRHQVLREDLQRRHIRSRVRLALASGGARLGVFGFDTCRQPRHWSAEEIALLRVLGESIASVLARQGAERELRASETRYRRVAAIMSDVAYCGVAAPDGDYRIDWITDSIEALTGYSQADVLARGSWHFMILPEDLGVFQTRIINLKPGDTMTRELRIHHRNGSLRWLRASIECRMETPESAQQELYGGLVDITESKRHESELQRLALLVEQSPSLVLMADLNGRIEYVNARFCELTGYSKEEMRGQPMELLNARGLSAPVLPEIRRALLRGQVWRGEFQNRKKSGEIYWEQALVTPLRNAHGVLSHFVKQGEDVSDKKALAERLSYLIHYDPLTGLPNRTLMRERIDRALTVARRDGHGLALLSIDLDKLKFVNDSLGHAAGDQLLREVARRLETLLNQEDTLARFGGDNFALLVGHPRQVHDIINLAERIRMLLEQPVPLGQNSARITACTGIALYPEDAQTRDALISHADAALHRAQSEGRRLYRFYTPALNAQLLEQFQLEQALRHGLEHGEMRLHYQPRVDIRTGMILSLEALIRWEHPQRGLVEPSRFIPIAESTGLILELGPVVLRQACEQLRQWRERGVPLVPIAVNLSAKELYQEDLAERVQAIMSSACVDPSQLEFEITESATLHSIDQAVGILTALRHQGFALSIDDFGTGYASLSYLNRLPMQSIKIDRSFLETVDAPVDSEAQGAMIVKAIIGLGANLGLHIIAEGVETEHQRDFLIAHGCHVAQGYLFSRPLPPEHIEPLLRAGQVPSRLH